MACYKGEVTRAKDLKKLLDKIAPRQFRILTNRPYRKGCLLVDYKTGKPMHWAPSNNKMYALVNTPGFKLKEASCQRKGFDLPEELWESNPKNESDKCAERIRDFLKDFMEWQDLTKVPRITLGEDDTIEIHANGVKWPLPKIDKKF